MSDQSGFTYDYEFSNWRKPYMARGQFMYGRYAVVISYDLPKEHVADDIVPVMPGWIIRKVRTLFGLPIWPRSFVAGDKVEREQAVIAAGKLFMSEAMWRELKARMGRP